MKRFFLYLLILIPVFTFAQKLQSPEEFLGYELGTRFTRHHKALEYYRYIASTLNNVKVENYGESWENRDLIVAILSSQENFNRLDEIRRNNLILTGLEKGTVKGEKKAIVWMSYNVHGNEAVSMEAAMQTLYELADPKNARTQEWLKNTVVILDPCINPDGRDRYTNFYNQFGSAIPNADPNGKEHHEAWPGGRANHYNFDLNRDWAWLKQIESEQRLKKYQEWMPMVHVDFHEQGVNSPYYFAPAANPLHKMITPWQKEFQEIVGKNNAEYFDQNNWLYFTAEQFDLLYPSYGDTYPMYNGAIGMTYEQGGSGRAGLTVETEFGEELTLKDRIEHHHTNGLSTVEITSKNADRVIEEFERFFMDAPARSEYKSFIVKGNNNREKLDMLAAFLKKHKIEFGYANAGRKAVAAFNYLENKTESFNVSENDLVINVYQPKSTLVSVLFEPKTFYSDSLTYDITAWSLPYVMGLKAYALKSRVDISSEFILSDQKVLDLNESSYAYFIPYTGFNSARFLAFLQKEGVNVRASGKKIGYRGREFAAGTLLITQRNNEHLEGKLSDLLLKGSQAFNVEVIETTTGFMDSGVDLGSSEIHYIKAPKVALLSGPQTSSYSWGEIWYFMEQELRYPVTNIDTDNFNAINLNNYDVLFVPSGRYSLFDDKGRERVAEWVSDGGRLILIAGALNSFVGKDGFALKEFGSENEEEIAEESNKRNPLQRYENQERESISKAITGAVYKVRMDNSHPLAYGYEDSYFTLKTSSSRYAWLKNEWNVGVLEKDAKAFAGFAGFKAEKFMSESLVFGVEDKGRGSIIYMVDNPLFRAFWENGKLLMSNAVFMVGM